MLLGFRHTEIEFSILVIKCVYYPLLVVQVDSDDVDKKGARVIEKDFKALGLLVDGTGVQAAFCSVPSVAENNNEQENLCYQ